MIQDLAIDILKIVVGSAIGSTVTYLVWVTKSLLKHDRDLKAAFTKIRALEGEIHDRSHDRAIEHAG